MPQPPPVAAGQVMVAGMLLAGICWAPPDVIVPAFNTSCMFMLSDALPAEVHKEIDPELPAPSHRTPIAGYGVPEMQVPLLFVIVPPVTHHCMLVVPFQFPEIKYCCVLPLNTHVEGVDMVICV